MLKRLLLGDLPAWMTVESPLLRYQIDSHLKPATLSLRRLITWVGGLSSLIILSYAYLALGLQLSRPTSLSMTFWWLLFIPLTILQIALRLAVFWLAAQSIQRNRQQNTWDQLRVTTVGIDLGLRTRLIAILAQVRILLSIVLITRGIAILFLFYDLTAFNGDYLYLALQQAQPQTPFIFGVLLLAAFIIAFLLMPLSALSLDISLGLMIAAHIKNRTTAIMIQVLVMVSRIVLSIVLVGTAWRWLLNSGTATTVPDLWSWLSLALIGDWGISLMPFSTLTNLWIMVPQMLFMGMLLLLAMLGQLALTDAIMTMTIRAAQTHE